MFATYLLKFLLPLHQNHPGDRWYAIVESADTELKQKVSVDELNDDRILSQIFTLFLGVADAANPDLVRSPASPDLRVKLLEQLMRSTKAAAANFMLAFRVAASALTFGVIPRLKLLGMQFLRRVIEYSPEVANVSSAELVCTQITRTLYGSSRVPEVAGLAYTALGLLSRKCPELFRSDLSDTRQLFNDLVLYKNDRTLQQYVLDALFMMRPGFEGITEPGLTDLLMILQEHANSDDDNVRLMVVRYFANVFPSSHVESRVACLLSTNSSNDNVREEAERGLRYRISEGADVRLQVPPAADVLLARLFPSRTFLADDQPLKYHAVVFTRLLRYLRHSIGIHAGASEDSVSYWEDNACRASRLPLLHAYLLKMKESGKSVGDADPVMRYQEVLERALVRIVAV